MPSSGILCHVALVRTCHVALVTTNVSDEDTASIIMVTRIGKLGTMLAATSNRSTL
jgi:hypothetical protein